MDCRILFEDDALLVVDKPAGMVVNRAETVQGETVQDWIEKNRGGKYEGSDDFALRSGTVHRIDKETSGILLSAKTPEAFVALQAQFKERSVHKTYLALVHGKLVPSTGSVNAPVGRLPWNREQFGIVPGGKDAVTGYKTIRMLTFTTPDGEAIGYSVVELYPETGRTHQIRVHMKYLGHPLLGDYLYAGRKTSRDDRVWAPRVMLHAWKLSCTHPVTRQPVEFTAPIPPDMESLLQSSREAS
jgi:23S rRNA pseudouridine1911/1915/1917 synthase